MQSIRMKEAVLQLSEVSQGKRQLTYKIVLRENKIGELSKSTYLVWDATIESTVSKEEPNQAGK